MIALIKKIKLKKKKGGGTKKKTSIDWNESIWNMCSYVNENLITMRKKTIALLVTWNCHFEGCLLSIARGIHSCVRHYSHTNLKHISWIVTWRKCDMSRVIFCCRWFPRHFGFHLISVNLLVYISGCTTDNWFHIICVSNRYKRNGVL